MWCPSWCFLFLAFTRNGVSLTSAWGWKRSIGASQRSNLLVTGASDSSLSLSKSEHLPRGGATLNANTTSSPNIDGEVAVVDPAEVRICRMLSHPFGRMNWSTFHKSALRLACFSHKAFFSFKESWSTSRLVSIGRHWWRPSRLGRVTCEAVLDSLSW